MEGTFIETIVKTKTTGKGWALRIGVGILAFLCFASFIIIGPISIMITFLIAYGETKVIALTSLEYEYSYLNGEITIDKIMGQMRRKRVIQVDLKDCEVAAYEGSAKLDYHKGPDVARLDYSTKEPDNKKFVVVCTEKGKKSQLIFEPTENMVDAMVKYAPNKVFTV